MSTPETSGDKFSIEDGDAKPAAPEIAEGEGVDVENIWGVPAVRGVRLSIADGEKRFCAVEGETNKVVGETRELGENAIGGLLRFGVYGGIAEDEWRDKGTIIDGDKVVGVCAAGNCLRR